MTIKSAEFVKGVVGDDAVLYDNIPHIAFIGRSNVGKSSVINVIVGRKKLVKSSSTPGKTRQINFFLIDEKVYFVDLPGYGFAKVSFTQREIIRQLILWYLTSLEIKKRRIVLIIDAKVGLTKLDLEMLDILNANQTDYIILANKADKLKRNDRQKSLSAISKHAGDRVVLLFSAKSGEGKKELLTAIFK